VFILLLIGFRDHWCFVTRYNCRVEYIPDRMHSFQASLRMKLVCFVASRQATLPTVTHAHTLSDQPPSPLALHLFSLHLPFAEAARSFRYNRTRSSAGTNTAAGLRTQPAEQCSDHNLHRRTTGVATLQNRTESTSKAMIFDLVYGVLLQIVYQQTETRAMPEAI